LIGVDLQPQYTRPKHWVIIDTRTSPYLVAGVEGAIYVTVDHREADGPEVVGVLGHHVGTLASVVVLVSVKRAVQSATEVDAVRVNRCGGICGQETKSLKDWLRFQTDEENSY